MVKNSYYHYVVILKNKKVNKTLVIMDPARGIIEMSYDDFNLASTGIFIVFDSKDVKRKKDNRLKLFLIDIYKENKKYIRKILFISFIYIVLSIFYSSYLKVILNTLESKSNIFIILTLFLVIAIIKNLIELLRSNISIKLKFIIDKKIHRKLIVHIFSLPYKYFCQKTLGEFNILSNDIANFKEIVSKIFIALVIDVFVIISILIYLFFISKVLIPIFILFILIIIYIAKKYQYILNNNYRLLRSENIKNTSYFINSLMAFTTIKSLHIENKIIDNNVSNYKDFLDLIKKHSRYNMYYDSFISNITDFTYIVFLFILSLFANSMKIDVLNIVLFSSVFYLVLPFVIDISSFLSTFKIYEDSINKILDLLNVKEEDLITTKLDNIKLIEFRNISFSFDDKKLINKFNLKIRRKDKIMIIGRSGAGKSTLFKLLLRFYDLKEGKILIDNIDVKDLDLDFIRGNITYVSQNEVLFNDTVLNNLLIVNKDIEKIKDVCKIVRLKIDLNFLILDGASNISGGEMRKIIIARALLKAKDILVLDESFNEMEVREEKKILLNIFKNYKNLGIVYITHRKDNFYLFNKTILVGGDNEKCK